VTVVPSCPSDWREKVEAEHLVADEWHAERSGRERNDYRDAAAVRLPLLLDRAEVRMRVREADLEGWLREGVFETIHGAGETSGLNDPALRIEIEAKVLGVPVGAGDAERPRYGYMQGSTETGTTINQYGKILVRFRDGVRDRATTTFGDSMGSTRVGERASLAPESLLAPDLPCRFSDQDVVDTAGLADSCDQGYRYAEAQIYGPLTPADIREVVFCAGLPAPDDLRNRLGDWSVAFFEIDGYPT
jgi:hypothetical protein